MKKQIKKHIKKIMIIWVSLLCMLFGVYASVVVNNANFYRINADQSYICLTGQSGTYKYSVLYNPSVQSVDLFVPKKTDTELISFINAAKGSNSFGGDAYLYDAYDGYGEICGTYNNCSYGISHGAGYDNVSPGCAEWRYCTTPCGEVSCGGRIACPQP